MNRSGARHSGNDINFRCLGRDLTDTYLGSPTQKMCFRGGIAAKVRYRNYFIKVAIDVDFGISLTQAGPKTQHLVSPVQYRASNLFF